MNLSAAAFHRFLSLLCHKTINTCTWNNPLKAQSKPTGVSRIYLKDLKLELHEKYIKDTLFGRLTLSEGVLGYELFINVVFGRLQQTLQKAEGAKLVWQTTQILRNYWFGWSAFYKSDNIFYK